MFKHQGGTMFKSHGSTVTKHQGSTTLLVSERGTSKRAWRKTSHTQTHTTCQRQFLLLLCMTQRRSLWPPSSEVKGCSTSSPGIDIHTRCQKHFPPFVELAIKRWTRHHVHNAHHISSSEEEKAPPGRYKGVTSHPPLLN
jgi:hypothetical protein